MKNVITLILIVVSISFSACTEDPNKTNSNAGMIEASPRINGITVTTENGIIIRKIGAPNDRLKIESKMSPLELSMTTPNPCRDQFTVSFELYRSSKVALVLVPAQPSYTLKLNTQNNAGCIVPSSGGINNRYVIRNQDLVEGSHQFYFSMNNDSVKVMPGYYRLYVKVNPIMNDMNYYRLTGEEFWYWVNILVYK